TRARDRPARCRTADKCTDGSGTRSRALRVRIDAGDPGRGLQSGENLHGDWAIEPRVAGFVHFAPIPPAPSGARISYGRAPYGASRPIGGIMKAGRPPTHAHPAKRNGAGAVRRFGPLGFPNESAQSTPLWRRESSFRRNRGFS